MDLISVIVPIYKVEPYLDRCIRSIVEQTYTNLEIILVDDGSPDGCGAICDAWAVRDSRIKVIHKVNGGLSDARNAGMAIAVGEFISFIDSDDTIEPEFLEKLHRALMDCSADIAECAASHVDEAGHIMYQRSAAPLQVMDKIEALRRLVLEDGIYQTVWNKLYRRHVAMGILFAVGKYNEDEFWTYKVFDRISKLAVVPECLYNYLQRGSSIMGVGYNIRRLDGLEARFQRMEYLQKYKELAALTRQQLLLDCMWHLQSIQRIPADPEKRNARLKIFDMMENTPPVPSRELTVGLKYRVWLMMFETAPIATVWVRNLLKIGL